MSCLRLENDIEKRKEAFGNLARAFLHDFGGSTRLATRKERKGPQVKRPLQVLRSYGLIAFAAYVAALGYFRSNQLNDVITNLRRNPQTRCSISSTGCCRRRSSPKSALPDHNTLFPDRYETGASYRHETTLVNRHSRMW